MDGRTDRDGGQTCRVAPWQLAVVQWLVCDLAKSEARSSKRKGKDVRRGLESRKTGVDGAQTTDRDGQIFRPQDAGLETQVLNTQGSSLSAFSSRPREVRARCDAMGHCLAVASCLFDIDQS